MTPDEERDTLPADPPTPDPYDGIAGVEVPRARTQANVSGLRYVLREGHHGAFGEWPSEARLRASWCMLAVEHGGRESGATTDPWPGYAIFCWNLGNIDVTPDWHGDWFVLTADEVIHGHRSPMTKRLRAHDDAVTGAADYWRLLADNRFTVGPGSMATHVLAAMDAADFTQTARALKAGGWFTADTLAYMQGMLAWARVYDRSFGR